MTRTSLTLLAVLAAATPAVASPTELDVQVDPTPFFLAGFAPEVGVTLAGHRAYATVVGYDVPRFLREDPRFAERRNAIVSVGYEYFVRGALAGPFLGINGAVTNATFSLADGGSRDETVNTFRVATRLGWVIYPIAALPGLFLGPWLSVGYSVAPRAFAIDGQMIERKAIGFTGAAQLGWRF